VRALELVPAELSAATRAQILLDIAKCDPEVSRDLTYAEEAMTLARQAGDQAVEANAVLTLAMFKADAVAQQAAPDSEAIRQIAAGRALAEQAGAHDLLIKAAINESHLLEGAGEHDLAAESAARGVATAGEQGLLRTQGSILDINQAEPLAALGRWDQATELAGATWTLPPRPRRRPARRCAAPCTRISTSCRSPSTRSRSRWAPAGQPPGSTRPPR
jgi:hypothetical protein